MQTAAVCSTCKRRAKKGKKSAGARPVEVTPYEIYGYDSRIFSGGALTVYRRAACVGNSERRRGQVAAVFCLSSWHSTGYNVSVFVNVKNAQCCEHRSVGAEQGQGKGPSRSLETAPGASVLPRRPAHLILRRRMQPRRPSAPVPSSSRVAGSGMTAGSASNSRP